MADLQRTIEIIFEGTDSISGTLNTIGGNVSDFGSDMQDIGQPFADATTKVLALDIAIAGLAIAGITASAGIETETGKMVASLGLLPAEAEKFKTVALDVYSAGYGDDMAAAFDAVVLAQKKLGDSAETDIGKVTQQALKIQKVFDIDVNNSLSGVKTLMENFGLSSEEAFDFIVSGYQKGLDGSGDFIESINEYATQFKDAGVDAGGFFSVMETGFSEGMAGTDKAADMFKEFRIRIQDDSTLTNESLAALGIDPVKFKANMDSGKMTAGDAFSFIIQKLNKTKDQTVLFNSAVGLMGTPFEDLGTKAALEINLTKTKIDELSGAMADIDTKTFEQNFTAALRTITTEFGKMEQWESAKIVIGKVFTDIAKSFGNAMDTVDFSGLEDSVGEIWDKIAKIFVDNDLDLTATEGMASAIQIIVDSMESIAEVTSGIIDTLGPAFTAIVGIAKEFNSMEPGTKEFLGNILGLGSAMVVLGGAVSVGGSLLSGLGSLVGFFSPGGALATGAGLLSSNYAELSKLQQMGAIAIAFTVGWNIGGVIRDNFNIDQYVQEAIRDVDKLINFTGTMGEVDLGKFGQEKIELEIAGKIDKDLSDFFDDLDDAEVLVSADVEINNELEDFFGELDDYENNYNATLKFDVDEAGKKEIEEVTEEIKWFDADGKEHSITVKAESSGIKDVKKNVEAIPTEKMLEIKLQGGIDTQLAKIKTDAELIQTAMEWEAKVEIAEAETAAKKIEAAFDAATDSVEATSQAAADMFGDLVSNMSDLSTSDKWYMQDVLEDQMDLEQQAIDIQKDLTDAQIKYMEAKADALKNGDGLIKIDTTGVEPAIEMVMWQIIEKVQIKANAESADFLLGI